MAGQTQASEGLNQACRLWARPWGILIIGTSYRQDISAPLCNNDTQWACRKRVIHWRSERVCDRTKAFTGGYVLPGGGHPFLVVMLSLQLRKGWRGKWLLSIKFMWRTGKGSPAEEGNLFELKDSASVRWNRVNLFINKYRLEIRRRFLDITGAEFRDSLWNTVLGTRIRTVFNMSLLQSSTRCITVYGWYCMPSMCLQGLLHHVHIVCNSLIKPVFQDFCWLPVEARKGFFFSPPSDD